MIGKKTIITSVIVLGGLAIAGSLVQDNKQPYTGKNDILPFDVPQGSKFVRFDIDVSEFTESAKTMKLDIEESFDGGNTWQYWMGLERPGQVFKDDSKQPTNNIYMEAELSPKTNKIRGTLTVNGGQVSLGVTPSFK